MENKEDTLETAKKHAGNKEMKTLVDERVKEEKKESKHCSEKTTEVNKVKVAEVVGVAELLGQTASILSLLVQKEEEKPKFSLNPEDVDIYKEAFNDFDHNKDGHISTQVR